MKTITIDNECFYYQFYCSKRGYYCETHFFKEIIQKTTKNIFGKTKIIKIPVVLFKVYYDIEEISVSKKENKENIYNAYLEYTENEKRKKEILTKELI